MSMGEATAPLLDVLLCLFAINAALASATEVPSSGPTDGSPGEQAAAGEESLHLVVNATGEIALDGALVAPTQLCSVVSSDSVVLEFDPSLRSGLAYQIEVALQRCSEGLRLFRWVDLPQNQTTQTVTPQSLEPTTEDS